MATVVWRDIWNSLYKKEIYPYEGWDWWSDNSTLHQYIHYIPPKTQKNPVVIQVRKVCKNTLCMTLNKDVAIGFDLLLIEPLSRTPKTDFCYVYGAKTPCSRRTRLWKSVGVFSLVFCQFTFIIDFLSLEKDMVLRLKDLSSIYIWKFGAKTPCSGRTRLWTSVGVFSLIFWLEEEHGSFLYVSTVHFCYFAITS